MLNYNKNKLINTALDKYYETFSHTLDTADFVPDKFNDKINKYIFKNMKKAFKKIDKEDKIYQKSAKKQAKMRKKEEKRIKNQEKRNKRKEKSKLKGGNHRRIFHRRTKKDGKEMLNK